MSACPCESKATNIVESRINIMKVDAKKRNIKKRFNLAKNYSSTNKPPVGPVYIKAEYPKVQNIWL